MPIINISAPAALFPNGTFLADGDLCECSRVSSNEDKAGDSGIMVPDGKLCELENLMMTLQN